MSTENLNNQDSMSHLLAGAILSGAVFFVLFAIHNYTYAYSPFDFSFLQFVGIISAITTGSGAMYYKYRDEHRLAQTFLKLWILVFASSLVISGAKIIYFKETIVKSIKYVHTDGAPPIVVGLIHIISAIWSTWFLFTAIKKK